MGNSVKAKKVSEFGDFQTPFELSQKACQVLARLGVQPQSIIEPTCGRGNLLRAALERFPFCEKAVGVDISPTYVAEVKTIFESHAEKQKVEIIEGDFFKTDWSALIKALPEPLLVIGNPPWITNASLSVLQSSNIPTKSNFQNHTGLDAVTGKSNFDVSEWMLIQLMKSLNARNAVMAMMCKTSVARKLLSYAAKSSINLRASYIFRLNALSCFEAAVDACFFVCEFASDKHAFQCRVYDDLDADLFQTIAFRNNRLIACLESFERWQHLCGESVKWRSGIKHDCSKVMELWQESKGNYRNGFGELVELEGDYLFPMLKTSEVASVNEVIPKRFMLVPQKHIGQDTSIIAEVAPQTWSYLKRYADLLDNRKSSIYRNRPRFSVFGIGDYSFAKWKVAISGFYKRLSFKAVNEHDGKPIVLDDTSYFVPCSSRIEAEHLAELLNSNIAQEFYSAYIFWDAKRPITAELLRRLDLRKLERETYSTIARC